MYTFISVKHKQHMITNLLIELSIFFFRKGMIIYIYEAWQPYCILSHRISKTWTPPLQRPAQSCVIFFFSALD